MSRVLAAALSQYKNCHPEAAEPLAKRAVPNGRSLYFHD